MWILSSLGHRQDFSSRPSCFFKRKSLNFHKYKNRILLKMHALRGERKEGTPICSSLPRIKRLNISLKILLALFFSICESLIKEENLHWLGQIIFTIFCVITLDEKSLMVLSHSSISGSSESWPSFNMCQPYIVWQETFGQHQVQKFSKCFGIFLGEKINFSKTAQNCLKIILEQ